MGRIIAVSGGSLESTKAINQYAVKMTEKENANVLFIGTASKDEKLYRESVKLAFGALGCKVRTLNLYTEIYSAESIDKLLEEADLIYIGGGDPVFMMEIWKTFGLDYRLKHIYDNDKAVLMGLSAGAICWFDCGHSDREKKAGKENWRYTWAEGMLGIYHFALCPHYDEPGRESFDAMITARNIRGIALENDTAFVENNGEFNYMKSREEANVYELEYCDGGLQKQMIEAEYIG